MMEILSFREALEQELHQGILPYWTRRVFDPESGTFTPRIDGNNRIDPNGTHSIILQTRILWTFAAVTRLIRGKQYLPYLDAALSTLEKHFLDRRYGGFYWSLESDFSILDDAKRSYGQSFAIYAYAEAYLATGREELKTRASDLFLLLDEKGFIEDQGAWHEGFSRAWDPLDDVRISPDDPLEIRSTNTHLHLMEAFANLYRIWPDPLLKNRIHTLLSVFLQKIYHPEEHYFRTFFDDHWHPTTKIYSFGHDIETVWLMLDAAQTISDPVLVQSCEQVLIEVADHLMHKGIDPKFGGIYQLGKQGAVHDTDKHWWPQAEALIGLTRAASLTGNDRYLKQAMEIWNYVTQTFIDREGGEWFFRVDRFGEPYYFEDKAGPWKCPYHTSRAMMETARLLSNGILTSKGNGTGVQSNGTASSHSGAEAQSNGSASQSNGSASHSNGTATSANGKLANSNGKPVDPNGTPRETEKEPNMNDNREITSP